MKTEGQILTDYLAINGDSQAKDSIVIDTYRKSNGFAMYRLSVRIAEANEDLVKDRKKTKKIIIGLAIVWFISMCILTYMLCAQF